MIDDVRCIGSLVIGGLFTLIVLLLRPVVVAIWRRMK